MSPNNRRLRELGYSSDESGNIICHRQGATLQRFLHERCGVLRIELEQDSKAGRELVDKLLTVVDEPRALIGRTRNGSAIVLFQVTTTDNVALTDRYGNDCSFEFVSSEGAVRFKISCTSDAVLNPSEYTWAKNRSPTDVPRNQLAVLFADIGQTVVDAAKAWGAKDAEIYDEDQKREREWEARKPEIERKMAEGYYSEEAEKQRQDEDLVRGQPEDMGPSDGPMGFLVFAARRRIALRKQAREEAAQAAEDAAIVANASDGARAGIVEAARRRIAKRQEMGWQG